MNWKRLLLVVALDIDSLAAAAPVYPVVRSCGGTMTLTSGQAISRIRIDKPKALILPSGKCAMEGTFRVAENPVLDFWIRIAGSHSVALNFSYGNSGIGYDGYSGAEDHVINIVGKQVGIAEIGDLGPVNDGAWHHVVLDLAYAIQAGLGTSPQHVGDIRLWLWDRQGQTDVFANGTAPDFPTTVEMRGIILRPRMPNEAYFNELLLSLVLSPLGVSSNGAGEYLAGGFLVSRHPLKDAWFVADGAAARTERQLLGYIEGRKDFALRLQVPSGKTTVTARIVDGRGRPLLAREMKLPGELTYLRQATVNIIPNSHNDIGWLDTPGATADWRREKVIGPAVTLLTQYPEYRYGMESNLYLMEYLNRAPDQAGTVRGLIAEGRLAFGATYNQPYPSLWSGESFLRQLYYGRKWLKEKFGPGVDTVTAWNTDPPTVGMQMPQILAKSGVKFLMLGRFRPGIFDWYSPDGSKVAAASLGIYWPLGTYLRPPDGLHLALQVSGLLRNWDSFYRQHRIPPQFPISDMTDYMPPTKELLPVVSEWQAGVQEKFGVPFKVKFATGEELMKSVTADSNTALPEVRGEWPNVWAYIHGPTHHKTISAGREAESDLVSAEKFWTLRYLASGGRERYPRETFDQAWMAHIYPDHGFGGFNGDLTDAVFEAKEKEALLLGRALLNSSVEWVAHHAAPLDEQHLKLVILNPLSWDRSGPVLVEIPTPADSEAIVFDAAGRTLPAQRVPQPAGGTTRYVVETNGIPANGYATFTVHFKPRQQDAAVSREFRTGTFENSFYQLEFAPGGLKCITDRQLGEEMVDTAKFLAGEVYMLNSHGWGAHEEGDFQHPSWSAIEKASQYSPAWRVIESGPVRTGWRLETAFRYATVRLEVYAYEKSKRLDFDVQLLHWSGERDKEFRIAMPINLVDAKVAYEVPYGVLEVNTDEIDGMPFPAWYSRPASEIHPREIQNWISASDGKTGAMLSSSVSVADYLDAGEKNHEATLLQPILLASRKSCHSLGNWYEQKGDHSYHFAFTSFVGGWKNSFRFGSEANAPFPSAVVTPKAVPPSIPSSASLCRVSGSDYIVSDIKIADDYNGVIVRGYEIAGRDSKVTLQLPLKIEKAIPTNLIEEDTDDRLSAADGQVQFNIGHRAINALRITGRWSMSGR